MSPAEAERAIHNLKASFAVSGLRVPDSATEIGRYIMADKIDADEYIGAFIKRNNFIPRALIGENGGGLKNRFGITDKRLLKETETALSFLRLCSLERAPLKRNFDDARMRSAHRAVFGDLYYSAGEYRVAHKTLNGSDFADFKQIPRNLKNLLSRLAGANLSGKSRADAATYLAYLSRELFILSPFAAGNGRLSRHLFRVFCRVNGFNLDYCKCPPAAYRDAQYASFFTDGVKALYGVFLSCLSYVK